MKAVMEERRKNCSYFVIIFILFVCYCASSITNYICFICCDIYCFVFNLDRWFEVGYRQVILHSLCAVVRSDVSLTLCLSCTMLYQVCILYCLKRDFFFNLQNFHTFCIFLGGVKDHKHDEF